MDLGLEKTGRFQTVACIEKNPIFCETIRLNQKKGRLPAEAMVLEADISKLSPKEVLDSLNLAPENIDLIIGGPPCQSFSTAGKRGTVQDPRGTLLWDFLRFVEYVQPRFFLMENVRGLLSAALKHRPIAERPEKGGRALEEDEKPGSVVSLFARDLALKTRNAYHLDIFEVNAVNYGAPQIRERVLFIGNAVGAQIDFPDPTHGCAAEIRNPPKQLSFFEQQSLQPWRTLRDALGDLAEADMRVLDFSPRKKKYLSLIPPGANWRSLPEELQKESMGRAWFAKGGRSGWWRRLTWDLPSPTLVTMPNHASTSLCHPTETRALSIREYARIQEFPDDWEFAGSTSEQYVQVGNAVPVRLGQVAGNLLAHYLEANQEKIGNAPKVYNPPRIIYMQSHIRTRKWYKDGKPVVWHNKQENSHALQSPPKTNKKLKTLA